MGYIDQQYGAGLCLSANTKNDHNNDVTGIGITTRKDTTNSSDKSSISDASRRSKRGKKFKRVPRLIKMVKTTPGQKFGIAFKGSRGSPTIISRLIPGGLQQGTGLLVGDVLISVNGKSTKNCGAKNVVQRLQEAPVGKINLAVTRLHLPEQDETDSVTTTTSLEDSLETLETDSDITMPSLEDGLSSLEDDLLNAICSVCVFADCT